MRDRHSPASHFIPGQPSTSLEHVFDYLGRSCRAKRCDGCPTERTTGTARLVVGASPGTLFNVESSRPPPCKGAVQCRPARLVLVRLIRAVSVLAAMRSPAGLSHPSWLPSPAGGGRLIAPPRRARTAGRRRDRDKVSDVPFRPAWPGEPISPAGRLSSRKTGSPRPCTRTMFGGPVKAL
jgi:hypothetical protein